MSVLAIDGGVPAVPGPLPPRRFIGEEERAAVLRVFDRAMQKGGGFDRYGGEEVDSYEREFAAFCGVRCATAVSSGTAAIHAALAALHPEPGDEIVCAPITDPGAVMPVVWMQCIPIFADTEPGTFNMSPEGVARVLSPRTRAIVVAHIAGEPADLDPILSLARERGIPVIEDCAQAHAATYRGRVVGGFGVMGCFSMMSGKHHTSGGQGGMIVSDDEALALEAKRFADRGKPFGSTETTNLFLGLNYRMTELAAAVGREQMKKVPAFVARRQALAERFFRAIAALRGVAAPRILPDTHPAYWFLRVKIEPSALKVDKEQFARAVRAEGVPGAATYTSIIYRQKWFAERRTFGSSGLPWTSREYGRDVQYSGSCPNAEKALSDHMILGWSETLNEDIVDAVAEAIAKVERAYRR